MSTHRPATKLLSCLLLAALASNLCTPAFADTASDKAAVDLDQARLDYYKSQFPSAPDKSLIPASPGAPKLAATADRHAYLLSSQLAEAIATGAVARKGSATTFALNDGKFRTALSTYKSVLSALGAAAKNVDEATKNVNEVVKAQKASQNNNPHLMLAPLAILAVPAILSTVVGFANIFRPQYSFDSSSQKDIMAPMLASMLLTKLQAKGVNVVDPSISASTCVENVFGSSLPFACPAGANNYIGQATARLTTSIKTGQKLIDDTKVPAKPDDKDPLPGALKTLQGTLDDANKSLATLQAVDTAGNSLYDTALRIEPLIAGLNSGNTLLISVSPVASDSDIISDTAWYRATRLSLETVALAQWQLTRGDGTIVALDVACKRVARVNIRLNALGDESDKEKKAAVISFKDCGDPD